MAFTKLTTILNKISTLATIIRGQESTVKAAFDYDVNVVKTYINDTLIPELEQADSENMKLANLSGQAVYGTITFDSNPIVPTPISDLHASTKKYVDDVGTAKTNDLNTHKSSSDHDARYNTKAEIATLDSTNVKLTGSQTISGLKTFSTSPLIQTPTFDTQASTKKYVDDVGAVKSAELNTHKSSSDHDSRYYTKAEISTINVGNVRLTGNQTVGGIKTFSINPIVPAPTADTHASTKKYVDDMGTSKTNDLNTHKDSADHDGRYYTESEINNLLALRTLLTGNHEGTWQGYSPVETDPGIQAVVNDHTTQLAQNTNQLSVTNSTALEATRMARLLQRAVEGLKGEQISVTLTNSLAYPFNNSKKTVSLTNPTNRNTKDYTVMVEVVSAVGGGVGDILITDKLLNGFKVEHTGAATSVSIICYVRGGM